MQKDIIYEQREKVEIQSHNTNQKCYVLTSHNKGKRKEEIQLNLEEKKTKLDKQQKAP